MTHDVNRNIKYTFSYKENTGFTQLSYIYKVTLCALCLWYCREVLTKCSTYTVYYSLPPDISYLSELTWLYCFLFPFSASRTQCGWFSLLFLLDSLLVVPVPPQLLWFVLSVHFVSSGSQDVSVMCWNNHLWANLLKTPETWRTRNQLYWDLSTLIPFALVMNVSYFKISSMNIWKIRNYQMRIYYVNYFIYTIFIEGIANALHCMKTSPTLW